MYLSKKEKIGLIIFISILLCIISYNYFSNRKKSIEVISKETQENKNSNTPLKIKAYICGEVVKPGVYTVNEGDRVITLVDMAGGFKSTADQYGVNLSMKIKDEDFIKIPSKQETAAQIIISGTAAPNTLSNGKININTADKTQLESLPRIGEAIAQRIIDYRNKNGQFKKIEEITNVSGIGQKTFDGFKDKITVN
jgi:competence protein ComEA